MYFPGALRSQENKARHRFCGNRIGEAVRAGLHRGEYQGRTIHEFFRRLSFATRGASRRGDLAAHPCSPSSLPDPGANLDNRGEFCAPNSTMAPWAFPVLLDDTLARLRAAGAGLDLVGTDPLTLARRYVSGTGSTRLWASRAPTPLTRCLFDRRAGAPPASGDSIGELDPQPGERIGMIGYFKPLLGMFSRDRRRPDRHRTQSGACRRADGYRVTPRCQGTLHLQARCSPPAPSCSATPDTMLGYCRKAQNLRSSALRPGAARCPFARVTFLGALRSATSAFIDALESGNRKGRGAQSGTDAGNTIPVSTHSWLG